MWQQLIPALRITLVMTLLTGVFYPAVVTQIAQTLFRHQANGSLIERNGHVLGSELIGQQFTGREYFHPRPSAAGSGYEAAASGGSNYGPTSSKFVDRVKASVSEYRAANEFTGDAPPDAVLASASGLDPDITPANAELQSARIAKARGVASARIRQFVRERVRGRDLGLFGEPRVNVLKLNLALDREFPVQR